MNDVKHDMKSLETKAGVLSHSVLPACTVSVSFSIDYALRTEGSLRQEKYCSSQQLTAREESGYGKLEQLFPCD